jgi:diguanylate cyclase (GGDEF)-like protein/PAS domain S-box-containing protein
VRVNDDVLAPCAPEEQRPTFAALAEVSPDAALLMDRDTRIVWGNRAVSRLFGMDVADALGRSALDFLHPDDLHLAALSFSSVQSKEVGTPIELRVRGADGWRLIELIGAPIDDHLLVTVRDLTERRRWEVAGNEVARLQSLVQNAGSITILLSREGVVRGSSGAMARLLGVDQEWLEGRDIECIVEVADRPVLADALREVASAASVGRATTVDVRMTHAGGHAVPYALTITNLLDDPTLEALVVTGHDITDRVRTEAQLRSANSVLAATLESTAEGILVVDRTGTPTNFNRRFADMWDLEPERIAYSDPVVLGKAMERLADPAAFYAFTRRIYDDPECETHDVLALSDGRIFERASLPQRIDGRVAGRVWSFRDVTDHRRMEEELVHQAFHDPLTGLANKALFQDRIAHAALRLQRHGGRMAILFIDLDDFKTVNDSLGHSVGDELLVTVSERIAACLRPGDTAARLGGDEFAVLIEAVAGDDDAPTIAERIIDSLPEPVLLSGRTVAAAASVGITYADQHARADEVLRNADLAMYTAKAAGKNCFRVFADEMHRAVVERLDLETHLRGAAEREELVVHYQPIVEVATRRIVAMEALVRWNHPERGLLGPGSFVPFAEQGGLIDQIGHHVLLAACEQARRWIHEVGDAAPAISVNLSPRQLLDPRFPDRVEAMLHRCGLPANQLILEITEGALMEDPAAAVVSLERLSRLGVRLAVDDFGTGYSSLAYLQQFPVDLLKIDGAFIDDSLLQPGWSLAEVIVQIAHALGLTPIAEGVEHAVEAEALEAFGCELAQGFHFSRPVDADGAAELVRASAAAQASREVADASRIRGRATA